MPDLREEWIEFNFQNNCFFLGLTWIFGFLVLIQYPENTLYLGFVFAIIFCFFNSLQGVLIFLCSIVLAKVEYKHVNRLSRINTGSLNTEPFDLRKKIVLNGDKLSLVRFGKNLNNR